MSFTTRAAASFEDEAGKNGSAFRHVEGWNLNLVAHEHQWEMHAEFVGVKKQRLNSRKVLSDVMLLLTAAAGKFTITPARGGHTMTWERRTIGDDIVDSIVDEVFEGL